MKRIQKILSVLLALACILSLAACSKNKKKNGDDTQPTGSHDFEEVAPAASVEYVVWVMASSEPTKAVTTSVYDLTIDGEALRLTGTATLQIMKQGASTFAKYAFSQEVLSDASGEELKTTVNGEQYSDGDRFATLTDGGVQWNKYTLANAGMGVVSLGGAAVAAEGSGYKLTATFAAAQASTVLGQAIPTATGSITLTVTVADGRVQSSSLAYATADGAMSLTTVYTYAAESFSLPR